MRQRFFLACLILGSLALLGYSGFRSVTLSFTHDEGLSYTIIAEGSGMRGTSNDHLLNTAAMAWAYRRLGDREWCLRLANVLAHMVYLGTGLLILRELTAPAALLGFGLLNLNPFLLDFFGLARGYGIACAFSLLSLWLLQEAWQDLGTTRGRTFLFCSSVAMALAVLGNNAWLNLQVAFLAVALALIVVDYRTLKVRSPGYMAYAVAFLIVNGSSIVYIAERMLNLRAKGDLYAGTDNGFIRGTVSSLAAVYLYDAGGIPPAAVVLAYSALGTLVVVGVWLIVRMIRERRIHFSGILFCILSLSALAPIAEHVVFKTMFPADRSALYYVPLFAVLMACVANEFASTSFRIRAGVSAASLLLAGAMVIHFARTGNLTRTLLWQYDANTKDAITEVARLVRESGIEPPVKVGAFWPYEPAFNYYRGTRKYAWMERVLGYDPASNNYDFVYCPIGFDLGDARNLYSPVRQYPESNAELLAGPRMRK